MELGPITNPLNYAIGLMLGGGWILTVYGIYMLFQGKILTRIEANGIREENKHLRESNKELEDQNKELIYNLGPLVTKTFEEIRRLTEQQAKDTTGGH